MDNEQLDTALSSILIECRTGAVSIGQGVKEIKQAIEYYAPKEQPKEYTDIEKLAEKEFPKHHLLNKHDWMNLMDGFIAGYKAASITKDAK